VESVKAVSEIYAPASGEVLEANAELHNTPEKLNTDPHVAAWLIKARLTNASELNGLMDAAAYEAYIADKGKEASADALSPEEPRRAAGDVAAIGANPSRNCFPAFRSVFACASR